ncbi:MAG TPA: hypothetical protein VGP93_09080 [Polyangiaceae bacterium]|jgi:hypothetical protein|nr:hypothetical protein [Polyangiaceae bacterium]
MSTDSQEGARIKIDQEQVGKAVEMFDGFWMIATRHRPGASAKMPEINNRCLIFKLEENGAPLLLVVNGVEPAVIPEVKNLEQQTGLRVRYIVSPGGGHHLMMENWQEAFTEASVLLPPARIPRTAHGQKLMKLERVKLLDTADPLPQFKGQLDAVLFDGLLGIRDMPSAYEGGKENMFKMMWAMMTINDPVDELWLHHVPSGAVIAGENLGWMFTKAAFEKLPGMFRMMMQAEKVYVMKGGRKVGDAARVAECWRKILSWPAKTVMTYHDTVGHAFVGDGRAALSDAVKAVKQLPAS